MEPWFARFKRKYKMELNDQEARKQYDAAVASRAADPLEHEIEVLRSVHKSLSQLDPKARSRVLTYLETAYSERLN